MPRRIVRILVDIFCVALVLVTRLINAGVLWPIEFHKHELRVTDDSGVTKAVVATQVAHDPLLDFGKKCLRAASRVRNRWA
jgi:hypothetical protein